MTTEPFEFELEPTLSERVLALPQFRYVRLTDIRSREIDKIVYALVCGGRVDDLARMTLERMLETQRRLLDNRAIHDWHVFSGILSIMIDDGIRFEDKDPQDVFATTRFMASLPARISTALADGGILWMELLPYIKAAELMSIKGFKRASLAKLEQILEQHSLKLAAD